MEWIHYLERIQMLRMACILTRRRAQKNNLNYRDTLLALPVDRVGGLWSIAADMYGDAGVSKMWKSVSSPQSQPEAVDALLLHHSVEEWMRQDRKNATT